MIMRTIRKNYLGPLLAFPGFIVMFIILILPVGYTIFVSLFKCDYMQFTDFLWFDNYKSLLQDREIINALLRTFYVTIISAAISMVVGMLLAVWIDKCTGLFSYSIQLVGLIPWVTSMVVGALLWQWIMQKDLGLLNFVLGLFGIDRVDFLGNTTIALYSLIFVMTWRTIGYSMVMILAGLKGIPQTLLEASGIDGCNRFQTFYHVKVPLLKTPLLISSIVLTLSNFNNYVVPSALTAGGPGTSTTVITIIMYRMGFQYYNFGMASAVAFLIFMINLVMVVLYVKAVNYEI